MWLNVLFKIKRVNKVGNSFKIVKFRKKVVGEVKDNISEIVFYLI